MAPFGESLNRLTRRLFTSEEALIEQANRSLPPLPAAPPSVSIASPSPDATSRSPLFQTLPCAIRRLVLLEAFGDRLVHMHLGLERPFKKKHRHETWTKRHARLPPQYAWDTTRPAQWRWRSSKCHAFCYHHEQWRFRELRWRDNWREHDECQTDAECCYDTEAGPDTCFLGVMGWLLTCREAYHDGMDVLYGSNTIRLHGTFMFTHLRGIVPPICVDRIAMVSMFWDLGWIVGRRRQPGIGSRPEEYDGLSGLEQLLAKLPATLPNVRCLHLSLSGILWPEEQMLPYGRRSVRLHELTEGLLRDVLDATATLRGLTDLRVALPRSMYMPWVQEVTDTTLEFEEAIWANIPHEWMWRELTAYRKADDSGNHGSLKGFWVLHGISDLPPLTHRCFGS